MSHSQNLGSLIFDLSSVLCVTADSYAKMQKKRCRFKLLLALWALLICGYIVINVMKMHSLLSLYDTILFILLSIQLLTINFILVHKINTIFKE